MIVYTLNLSSETGEKDVMGIFTNSFDAHEIHDVLMEWKYNWFVDNYSTDDIESNAKYYKLHIKFKSGYLLHSIYDKLINLELIKRKCGDCATEINEKYYINRVPCKICQKELCKNCIAHCDEFDYPENYCNECWKLTELKVKEEMMEQNEFTKLALEWAKEHKNAIIFNFKDLSNKTADKVHFRDPISVYFYKSNLGDSEYFENVLQKWIDKKNKTEIIESTIKVDEIKSDEVEAECNHIVMMFTECRSDEYASDISVITESEKYDYTDEKLDELEYGIETYYKFKFCPNCGAKNSEF